MNVSTTVASFIRQRPSRKPLPEHLPRERVIVAGPVSCACCGGTRLSKLGEDITETLEVIAKSWKVIQHVRVALEPLFQRWNPMRAEGRAIAPR